MQQLFKKHWIFFAVLHHETVQNWDSIFRQKIHTISRTIYSVFNDIINLELLLGMIQVSLLILEDFGCDNFLKITGSFLMFYIMKRYRIETQFSNKKLLNLSLRCRFTAKPVIVDLEGIRYFKSPNSAPIIRVSVSTVLRSLFFQGLNLLLLRGMEI